MSAAISVWKGYVIPEMPWCITCWICDGLSAHDLARTQPEAVAAGLEHLREHAVDRPFGGELRREARA